MNRVQRCLGPAVAALAVVIWLIGSAAGCSGDAREKDPVLRGKQLLEQRDYAKARIEFRNALQADPANVEAWTLAGLASERLGEYEDAGSSYRAAIDLDPGQATARANLARMLLGGGATDQALELIDAGMQRSPQSAELLSVRAAARAQSDPTAARRDAEQALELAPNDPNTVAVLVSLMWRAGERDAASALLARAIAANPKSLDLRQMSVQLSLIAQKPAEAERQLVEIVRLEPDVIEFRARLAQVLLAQGKVEPALATLRETVKRQPTSVPAKLALAETLATHRTFAEAEKVLLGYAQQSPKDLDLQLAIGRFYESNERFVEAEAVYRRLDSTARDKPQAKAARNRIAFLDIRANRTDAAYALLQSILEEDPGDAEALVMRSQLALDRGDTQTAISDLRRALRDQPDSIALAGALADAHVKAGAASLAEQVWRDLVRAAPTSAEARLGLAQFLVDQGRSAEAGPILEQFVAAQPGNLVALEAMFRQQMFSGEFEAATKTASTIAALQPKRPQGVLFAGLALQTQKRYAEARKSYEQAASLAPASVEPVFALTRLDLLEGHTQAALARVDRRIAEAKAAELPLLHTLRGDVLMASDRALDAAQAYAAASRLAPKSVAPYRSQAAALYGAGRQDEAVTALEAGLKATGNAPELGLELAAMHEVNGRAAQAISTYERVLLRDPGNLVASNNLVMLLVGASTDARTLGRAAEIAAPLAKSENPAFLDTYGWVLFKQGRQADAIPYFERASGLAPDNGEIFYHLALAQSAVGKRSDARRSYEAALRKAPEAPFAAEARRALLEPDSR